jgi:hypothetical protein
MTKKLLTLAVFIFAFSFFVQSLYAFEPSKLGIHILNLEEVVAAKDAISLPNQNSQTWNYVTIPFLLSDINKKDEWQEFFDKCEDLKIIPLVRLTTEYEPETNAWKIPSKRNVYDQIEFLSKLNWPTKEKHIIVFNEVNHAKEWGGKIDPVSYAKILRFTAQWAHTENNNFVVLPAGMDLAAPNGSQTREAFNYLDQLHTADENIFELVDIWNSHSYPNPGFSSAPTRYAKNSLRGYQYELSYLKEKTGRDFKVMITETGWEDSPRLSGWLSSYYTYAMQHIWSDDRVLAVTPFVLRGAPGPFEDFSFISAQNKPTNQYRAMQTALEKVSEDINDKIVVK